MGRWGTALGNMGMRGAALGARFLLAVYLARVLGYEELGFFGILMGVAGVMPAVLGFGVSFHVNREILLRPRAEAYLLLRDRLALSGFVAGLLALLAAAVVAAGLMPPDTRLLLAGVIILLELVCFDLHIGLLHLRRPIAANFLLFVRSAAWILPVILIGLLVPALATLEVLLAAWAAALLIDLLLLPIILTDLPWRDAARRPVDWPRLRAHARRTPLVYANDLATTAQVYLDRFLVAQLIGVAAAGVYTLNFSVTHGLYVLAASTVTQMSPPRLMEALTGAGVPAWRAVIRADARRVLLVAVPLIVAAAAVTLLLLPALGFADFRAQVGLFSLMALLALIRPFRDLANAGLYSLGADRTLAAANLFGVALALVAGAAGLRLFGLIGIGISAVLTQAVLLVLLGLLLRRRAAAYRAGSRESVTARA